MTRASSLSGCRILVTRARQQASELSERLRHLQAEVVELPMISIAPPESWEPLDQALASVSAYDWIVFASVNAVKACLERAASLGIQEPLSGIKLAAIGPATAAELAQHGLAAAFTPTSFVAESLVNEFPGYPHLAGVRVLWPKANIGRTYIIDALRASGAAVDVVHCYKTGTPPDRQQTAALLQEMLSSRRLDVITLASAQTVRNLASCLSESASGPLLSDVIICVIGPETASVARELLGHVDIAAQQYTLDGMVEALCRYVTERGLYFGKCPD